MPLRALAAERLPCEDKLDVDRDRMLGLPPAASKSPLNERHTVKAFAVPSPAAQSLPRFRLGEEKAKTFLLISFKNSN